MPEDIFTVCQDVIMLHLSGNRLTILPDQLFNNLKYLEDLDMSKNELHVIPLHIFRDLTSLMRLNLAENQLNELSEGNAMKQNSNVVKYAAYTYIQDEYCILGLSRCIPYCSIK